MAQSTAPIAQQADASSAAAKQNILQNGPAGGEKNLALEQVDVNRGKTVGDAATQGFNGSFNALAQLSQQGVGESQTASGQATQGMDQLVVWRFSSKGSRFNKKVTR